MTRALRYGLVTTGLVLTVCAVLALVAGTALTAASRQLAPFTGRTVGTVSAVDGNRVEVRWTPEGGTERTDPVELAGPAPPVGTRTEVAYDPDAPGTPLVPGAAVLADADSELGTLYLAATVAALVVLVGGWQLSSRRHAAARPARSVPVRRVRIQSGLIARSWLETETAPHRWIPVHFDPVLVGLPSPATVRVHGDPLRDRLVAVDVEGRVLHPSGPVRTREPRGRRTDNPAAPDASTIERMARLAPLRRQFRADLPLLLPAPIAALLWTVVDGAGITTWTATTALLGALGLWLAALRGSDPS
ncbi:hypothetical protein FHX44_112108 [Pseudonocardia hierapolitana]|uniref:DUF3592 domain-containing protein n=1 Tax=Pseudonocardia hierapolitana TaxID=1128676 RepID=A0A561SMX9_9PSEU|nr:DUF3592 domain-containing protein [Pseudonocardia hierapolitana]TWF76219.1 hypothetical protein FHX44_112108 [Pseudonocardia hierapolitana]